MVNIVKFAQFYCIYLLSFAFKCPLGKSRFVVFTKTIYSMVVLPSGIGTLIYSTHFSAVCGAARYVPYNFHVF